MNRIVQQNKNCSFQASEIQADLDVLKQANLRMVDLIQASASNQANLRVCFKTQINELLAQHLSKLSEQNHALHQMLI